MKGNIPDAAKENLHVEFLPTWFDENAGTVTHEQPRFGLNHNVLGDDDRVSGGRDQAAVAADDALLIRMRWSDLRAFLNLRVLR